MTRFPTATDTTRHVLAMQQAGPARIARVTVRRDYGASVSFYEVARSGQVITSEDLAGAKSAAKRLNADANRGD